MVMILSAISVVQKTPDVLQIHVPAGHLGAVFLILGGLFLLFMGVISPSKHWKLSFLFFLAASVLLIWTGVSDWGNSYTATLSAVDQTLTVEQGSTFGKHTDSYPLSSVSQAVVQSSRNSNYQLFFAMKDGNEVGVAGTFMTPNGCYQAQQAINTFLAHHVSTSQAAPAPASNPPPGSSQ